MSDKELIQKDLDELVLKQQEEQIINLERYHFLKENGYVIFETITGSQSYGTNTEKSDLDVSFVYILPENDILGMEYKEQLKIHKDFMGYEIRRFLELLRKGNPTVLEFLYSPEDCILLKHPSFDILISQRDKFITKVCENSFYGYATQQRAKAEGLEKMQNWEISRVTKKTPIDFCYVPEGYDAIPVNNWLNNRDLDQLFCALTAVNHCRDLFAVFYDYEAHATFSERIPIEEREKYKTLKKSRGESMGLGYKGIAFEDSNDIRLSNIPMEERKKSICNLSYNKDGYRKHCDQYKKYQNWLENRNEARWVEIKGHGQKIDGKNMMHFMRLVKMGREIANGEGVKIRRTDAEELLRIRKGEISLQTLFNESDIILSEMKKSFQNSNLPEEVSYEFVHNLLVQIRKSFYYRFNNTLSESLHLMSLSKYSEEKNDFIIKAYGGLSELQHFISGKIVDILSEYEHQHLDEISREKAAGYLMNGFVYNNQRWPQTFDLKTGERQKVNLQRFSVVSWNRDKIRVVAGGEWQKLIQFDIVMWQDTLAAVNVKTIDELGEENKIEEFFKELNFNLVD